MVRRARGHFLKGLVVLFVLFLGFPGMAVGSPGQIQLEVDPGFDGIIKGEWVPVRVKISNSGGDVKGELIAGSDLNSDSVSRNRLFAAEWIELAGGTSKEVTLLLSGQVSLSDVKIQFRTEDGVVAQEPLGVEKIIDTGSEMAGMFIGVLSDSPDLPFRIHQWVGTTDGPWTRVRRLKVEEIPEKDVGLSGLDVLVMNGIEIDSLGKSRQRAIRRWVERGGLLVVAGPSSPSSFGEWGSILPVKVEGKATLKDLKPFSRWGSVPDLESPLTISRARLADGGQSVVSAGDLPLLARRPVGSGAVVYAAYDLASSPLAKWPGNERLWREMLILGIGDGLAFQLGVFDLNKDPSLEQALLRVPHLELPGLSLMAMLFLVYALGIGPITYWILSRVNRREWAWWVIPSLGILVSLGVYAYGQAIRGSDVLVHNLAYVETNTSGEAHVQGFSAFMSQGAGNYRLEGNSNLWLWPLFQGAKDRSEMKISTQPSVTFFGVPHWTIRRIFVNSTASMDGELRATARYHDGTWRGKVTNGTRLPLRDVTLVLGDQTNGVGSLAPGETKAFQAEDVSGDNREIPEPKMKQKWEPTREDLMQITGSRIRVKGWTEEPVFSYEVQGHETKAEHLSLVLGRVEVKPMKKGRKILWRRGTLFSWPLDGERFTLLESKGMATRENPTMMAYDLPSAPPKWKPLRIDFAAGERNHVEVYDWNKGKWVKASRLSDLSPDDLSAFVSPFNRVVVRREFSLDPHPLLEVEGRVVR